MKDRINRRSFLKTSALATAGWGAATLAGPSSGFAWPSDRIRIGVMGTGIRGAQLARGFAQLPGAEVAYLCDVDTRVLDDVTADVADIQDNAPENVTDFRQMLDDSNVDALVVGAADHWHAPASILAMDAGKHVYVEKPGSHNPREGELIVQAADQSGRVVQMGNQRRSWPMVCEAIRNVQEGIIGNVYFARAWYSNNRGPTHLQGAADPPDYLDWDLWQGPAPRVEYEEAYHPYDWHWFWRWGTGEAGNIGCHALDLCRWGMEVDYPTRVSSYGGKYHYDDDWETPDTQVISLDFAGDKTIVWESRSRNNRPIEGMGFGVSFHGEGGTVVISGGNQYSVYNNDNDLIREARGLGEGQDEITGDGFDIDYDHLKNFTDAIRDGTELNSPIKDGQKSTLLCHLGNIAHRTNQSLRCDPQNGHILTADQAMEEYWGREYAPGWEPIV